ncbi:MAG: hypothetical protein A2538_03355 [Candidatus Magasanikbacteria bacterium RIFOXYD2_FULL_41_14]|uniref:AAA+ ATPase domain-containing protein n=1 Tax=Candidatus Magasanikbacteria bacterium RIFOXYD2_FULL_41_14 TaxID=1798709 RepID=A0A1F6PGR8_9BACT|nr:MAG: hypothetical protein A2538_03355 [Candidatus Magasanikbacteria bacterium RIFOXYD2_FULL_41_14]
MSKEALSSGAQDSELYQVYRGHERGVTAGERVVASLEKNPHLQRINSLLAECEQLTGVDMTDTDDSSTVESSETNALAASKAEMARIEQILSKEQIESLSKVACKRVVNFVRIRRKVERAQAEIKEELVALITSVHDQSNTREATEVWQTINTLEEALALLPDQIDRLATQSPEAFTAHWLLRLRHYKKQYEKTGLIETPGVAKVSARLMKDVRKKLEGTNGVAVLLGDTGTGKTVMARKIAEELSPDGKYEFVGAHSRMTPDDLLHRFGITVEELDSGKVPMLIKKAQEKYQTDNPTVTGEQLTADLKTVAEVVKQHASEKQLVSKKLLEAVGRAMENGSIVVIDEFNYLSPETMAALNDVLSNANKTKPGFGIIMTGNFGKKFKRQGLDPALVNRLSSGICDYNYPPQEIDATLENSIISKEDADNGAPTKPRDLFLSGLTQSVDNKGNLSGPADTLDNLWGLSQNFALIQQVAGGKDIRNLEIGTSMAQGISKFNFESFFLSFRNYNSIVREWKLDGYEYSLDWYIYENVIRPAGVIAPREAAQLFYIFQMWGGKFAGNEWGGVTVDATAWTITGLETVPDKESFKRKNIPRKYFLPSEIVEAASGRQMPDYQASEEREQTRQEQEKEKFTVDMEKLDKELAEYIANNEYVLEICAAL